jgi:hypothetical protein
MVSPVIVLHLLENRVGRQEVEALKTKLQAQNNLLLLQWRDLDKLVSTVNGLKKNAGRPGGGRGRSDGNGSNG